jgi:hypothetical protein
MRRYDTEGADLFGAAEPPRETVALSAPASSPKILPSDLETSLAILSEAEFERLRAGVSKEAARLRERATGPTGTSCSFGPVGRIRDAWRERASDQDAGEPRPAEGRHGRLHRGFGREPERASGEGGLRYRRTLRQRSHARAGLGITVRPAVQKPTSGFGVNLAFRSDELPISAPPDNRSAFPVRRSASIS